MTADEMRDAIEALYQQQLPAGATFPAEVPAGVTPMDHSVGIAEAAAQVDSEEFVKRYAEPAAGALATLLSHTGCTHFARLTIKDRPAVSVPSQGGRGIARHRPRAFVVHALGWSSKPASVYVHQKSWPHAIGAQVPETSKRPRSKVKGGTN